MKWWLSKPESPVNALKGTSSFEELGWFGYFGVGVFVILLFVVLIYEWRNGALDFGPDGKKILKAYKELTRKESSNEMVAK